MIPIAWIAGFLPLAEVRRSPASMFYCATFTDYTGFMGLLPIYAIFVAGLVLFIVGLVKHRRWLWISGLIMLMIPLCFILLFILLLVIYLVDCAALKLMDFLLNIG